MNTIHFDDNEKYGHEPRSDIVTIKMNETINKYPFYTIDDSSISIPVVIVKLLLLCNKSFY